MLTMQPYTRCLICGESKYTIIATREQIKSEREYLDRFFRTIFRSNIEEYMFKDHIYFTHTYEAQLVACNNCGTICRDPRLTPEAEYLAYKNDEYHSDWLELSFQPYCNMFLADMPRLVKEVGTKCRVLEVGSQVGGFLYAANQYGWEAQGIDIGKCMVDFAHSKELNVQQAILLETNFPDAHFDAVFVWSCFEMLPDPQSDLQEIFRILKPGGWLYITVPNGDFIKITQGLTQTKLQSIVKSPIWNVLAYSILLGFPFQLGYSPIALRSILEKVGYRCITIRNLAYVPVSSSAQISDKTLRIKIIYLKFSHFLSEVIYWVSFRKLIKGSWIEVRCRK